MIDLANLDLRCAGPNAGLGKVRPGPAHAAVVVDRYAVDHRRGPRRSRQDRRCRSNDTQKDLTHCT
jgi:hypothetical protein